jgi:hypothetical protein
MLTIYDARNPSFSEWRQGYPLTFLIGKVGNGHAH